jgi:mRNA-degrading endonuclease RelE of RelBE toxin-antitoxin system
MAALADISRKPTIIKGDTIKPLSGDLKGLWRYRIGDYRLVYRPDETYQKVTLIAFDSRGSIYPG